jgi:hypothetical protein
MISAKQIVLPAKRQTLQTVFSKVVIYVIPAIQMIAT